MKIVRVIVAALAICTAVAQTVRAQEKQILPAGTYRLEMILGTITRLPFFGSSKSASKSVSLVEIRHEETGLFQTHQVCDFRVLEDSRMVKIVFPEKFVAALGNHSYPITIERNGRDWHYRADLGIERIGYHEEASNGQLPNTMNDPAVFDWDGDGHPGATLKLTVPFLPEGELYIVQRGHSILNGRITEPGKVEGSVDVRVFEQRVLGAKPAFLNRSPQIEPNAKESRFSLTALPQGSTCESLRNPTVKPIEFAP